MRLIDLLANMRFEMKELMSYSARSELRDLTSKQLLSQLRYALLITGRLYEIN